MKLDLTEIALNPGKRKSYIIDESGFGDLEEDVVSSCPIKGELTFTNTHDLIYVKGFFETKAELVCGRCLEMFSFDINREIEEVFPINGETENEDYLDDRDIPLYENYILDLSELLRQYILIEVPFNPLCSEECKGLCPGCGENLNLSECKCADTENNNPFSELLKDLN